MAASSDIRDIMELSAPADTGVPAPKPNKKAHGAAALARPVGMSREVYALMGDRAPPIPLGEQILNKYKSKPKYQQRDWKPRKWEQRSFVNGARRDGLVLRHWKLANPVARGDVVPVTGQAEVGDGQIGNGMVMQTSEDGKQVTTMRYSDEFPMEKFNVKVGVPKYTDEQYEAQLKSETWTKEETDHLMELCRDYDLRWFVIADRWNFDSAGEQHEAEVKPDVDAMDIDGQESSSKKTRWPPSRTMEDLKSRYYAVAAAMLAISRPPSDMLPSEYALWEKMQKFDAATEVHRKKLAEALFSRSEDEAMEEKLLLAELKRIVDYEDQFLAERRDIYARLEAVPSHRRDNDTNYQSSAALSGLLQNLLAKEKRGKMIRPPDAAAPAGATAPPAPPERTQSWEKGSHPNQYTRRNTNTEDGTHGPTKKGQPALNIRKLTAAEEAKYGVTHHDRLTSGVAFRHEKVIKLTQAKSQAQTLKLQGALTELEIPPRLVMPTEKVCREFERLIQNVNLLLDVRKMSEKIRSEVQVLEEARRMRLGLPKDGNANGDATTDIDKKDGHGEENKDPSNEEAENENKPDESRSGGGDDDNKSLQGKSRDLEDDDDTKDDKEDDAPSEEEEESKVNLDEDEDDAENEDQQHATSDVEADLNGEDEGEDEDEDRDDHHRAEEADELEDEDDGDMTLNLGEDHDEEDGSELGRDGDSDAADDMADEAEDADQGDDAGSDGGHELGDIEDDEQKSDQDDVEGDEDLPNEGGGDEELAAPPSAATRLHKRSASVISEASRAGSNRSVGGRKKTRR